MVVGGVSLALYVLVAVAAPLIAPYSPFAADFLPLESPSRDHLFGTDLLGRDQFSRVVYGTREVLALSLVSTTIAVVIGGVIGLLSGYRSGWVDNVLMRIFETLISIPFLVLALLLVAAAGPHQSGSWILLIGVVVLVYVPRVARMARAVALDLVQRDFVTVARARGESAWSIMHRELLPNARGVLLVEFGVRAGQAPLIIGGLGFLGFGARPPSPEWGLVISESRSAMGSVPMVVLAPAAALALLVVSLNLFTDGLARQLGGTAVRTP